MKEEWDQTDRSGAETDVVGDHLWGQERDTLQRRGEDPREASLVPALPLEHSQGP